MTLPPCSSEPLAGAGRASQVAVLPARYQHVEPLVPPDLAPLPVGPDAVVIGAGPRWGLCFGDALTLVDATGTLTLRAQGVASAALHDGDGVRLGNRLRAHPRDEPEILRPLGAFGLHAEQRLGALEDDLWICAVQLSTWQRGLTTAVIVRPNRSRSDDEQAPRWSFERHGRASVARSGRRILMAGDDGHAFVLADPSDPRSRTPQIIASLELPHTPYAAAALGEGFVLCSAIDRVVPSGAAVQGRLAGLGARAFEATWHTEVRALDADGGLRWCVVVELAVLQPPVSCGVDRVALLGQGIVCVEAGRVRWQRAPTQQAYGTAFADGTLALGLGPHLGLVDADGAMLQRFDLPESVVTPPAIGPDGAMCLATAGRTWIVPVSHA